VADERRIDAREVLLIVGGGISAYKSAIVARELMRRGAGVETVLTSAGQRFIGGVTFAGITGRAARTELWDAGFAGELHIELTRRAHAVLVAPATADLMARACAGIADDLATTCLLAASVPVVMAPAMHARMWEHPATRASVATLRARGVRFAGPVEGPLASGETGMGRMAEPIAIVDAVVDALAPGDLSGLRVLVSAGPTHEAIDPVRFVGNRSSGKMGVAIAVRARDRGADVTLVHGPMSTAVPSGVRAVSVRSALEMRDVIVPAARDHDAVVMAAAIADYRPASVAREKIKKGQDELVLRLTKNPDVLSELGALRGNASRPVLVGFAVETADLVSHAQEKLVRKRCDLIVANLAEHGFEGDDDVVTLVSSAGAEALPKLPKREVADRLLDAVLARVRALAGT
jgi:phosphopantothenoylcysteine decarboxylase/phosphopantothenate--cysteine ligase